MLLRQRASDSQKYMESIMEFVFMSSAFITEVIIRTILTPVANTTNRIHSASIAFNTHMNISTVLS